MKKPYKSDLLNYLVATSSSPRERLNQQRYFAKQQKKNYANYKLDCILLKKLPITFTEFKKKYTDKPYEEENIF